MTSVPGWYPDPSNPDLERFWDGQAWTADTRARHNSSGEQNLGDLFGGGGSGEGAGSMPTSWMNPQRDELHHPPRPSTGTDRGAQQWWQEGEETQPEATPEPRRSRGRFAERPVAPVGDTDERDKPSRRLAGRGRRMVVVVSCVSVLIFAYAVASAQRSRDLDNEPRAADVTTPSGPQQPFMPTVEETDMPTSPATPPLVTDPSATTEPLPAPSDEPSYLLSPRPTATSALPPAGSNVATATPATSATPKSTPAKASTPPSPPRTGGVNATVDVLGSSFGPGGLLAITWERPAAVAKMSGVRYRVLVKADGTTRSSTTSATQILFRGVPSGSCSITITVLTKSGNGKPRSFTCGR